MLPECKSDFTVINYKRSLFSEALLRSALIFSVILHPSADSVGRARVVFFNQPPESKSETFWFHI